MKHIFLFLIIATPIIKADILNIKVLKENESIEIYVNNKFAESGKGQEKKIINIILNRDKFFYKKVEEYKTYKILNKNQIKSKYIINKDNLKVFIPEKEFIEEFVIEAKPDKKLKKYRIE